MLVYASELLANTSLVTHLLFHHPPVRHGGALLPARHCLEVAPPRLLHPCWRGCGCGSWCPRALEEGIGDRGHR
jgi:hypothetical protein